MLRVLLLAAAICAVHSEALSGQLTSPSAHFGAPTLPLRDTGTYIGISLDRFTPNGKPDDPGAYNGVDRTIGFNFLSYSVASNSARWPNLTRRVTLQLGWGHDQPTEWIQNSLHWLARKPEIPSVNPRNNVLDAAFNAEVAHWTSPDGVIGRFIGGGVSVATPYSEAWLQVGVVSRFGRRGPELAATLKAGAPFLGGVFPDSTLAAAYATFEARFEVPLADWLGVAWLPSPFVGFQHETGFFMDVAGNPIAERHGFYGLVGKDGWWRFEIWNEHFGGRVIDKGPTGGGRLTIKVPDGYPFHRSRE